MLCVCHRREKVLAAMEEEDEKLAVELLYRAIQAPLMQARAADSRSPSP
jgi:hypothetical protein